MSLSVQYDKETQKMYVRTKSELLAVLDAKEADNFKQEYENALLLLKLDNAVEKNDYAQIIIDDFEMWLEDEDDSKEVDDEKPWYKGMVIDSKFTGINIEIRWMTRLNRIEDTIYLLRKDGNTEYLRIPDDLSRNFSKEQVKFGHASSRQIRRCFDENVLKYFEEHPDFIVKFCDVEVPRTVLLSDDQEMFFDFETSMDT